MSEPYEVAVFGFATLDRVVSANRRVYPGRNTKVAYRSTCLGALAGRGAETIAHAGGRVASCFTVGNDPEADHLVGRLKRVGVDTFDIRGPDFANTPFSTTLVYERSKQTSSIWCPPNLLSGDVPEDRLAIIDKSEILLTDVNDPRLTKGAIERAISCERRIVCDGGGPRDHLNTAIADIDYLVMPKNHLFGSQSSVSSAQMRKFRQQHGLTALILTDAERGYYLVTEDGARFHAAQKVETVDGCGAGEVFSGILALSLARGHAVTKSASLASWAAAQHCGSFGNDGIPDADALEFAARNGDNP